MELLLTRTYKKTNYTIGRLYINGEKICNILEDPDRGLTQDTPLKDIKAKKIPGKTAIPSGKYFISMASISERFKNKTWAKPYKGIVPLVLNVPGFEGIRIHPGTTAEDTEGCLIPGSNTAVGVVTNSQKTYHRLMKEFLIPAWERHEVITIEIM